MKEDQTLLETKKDLDKTRYMFGSDNDSLFLVSACDRKIQTIS